MEEFVSDSLESEFHVVQIQRITVLGTNALDKFYAMKQEMICGA